MAEVMAAGIGLHDLGALYCTACRESVGGGSARRDHYGSSRHLHNVKRKCADLPPLTREQFDERVAALVNGTQGDGSAAVPSRCVPCKKDFRSASRFQHHLNSKKHKKTIGMEASDEVDDVGLSAMETSEADLDVEEEKTPIPAGTCLFCSRSDFENLEGCVAHMHSAHGFFIPYVEYLTDLEALLLYLGCKVGIGHVCLWCDGRTREAFGSVRAVQQHMESKSHCKLRWEDNDDDDFPFEEFYDFDIQESSDGRVIAASTQSLRHPVEFADDGDIVLSDGARLGHRDYRVYYRQRFRLSHTRTSVSTLKQIGARYGANNHMTMRVVSGPAAVQRRQDQRIESLRLRQRMRYEYRSHKIAGKFFRDQTGLK